MDEDMTLYQMVADNLDQKKFSKLREVMASENPADLALLFTEFEEKDVLLLYRLLPKELASDTFSYMDSDMQENLINGFSDKELREVLNQTFIDDTVDMIEEMPANVVNRILRNCDAQSRNAINQILKYPEDSAGTLMTIEYVNLNQHLTVKEAISRIRKVGPNKETIYTCYVTKNRTLLGLVTVKDLLLADDEELVENIMIEDYISVTTLTDKDEVGILFSKYDLLNIPVTDNENRLVGVVSIDDAVDVITEEATEDFELMAAMSPSEKPYMQTGVFTLAKNRIVWLLLLMISATVSGAILTNYEDAFSAYPLLVTFITMLTGTGGNAGSQTATLVIRGMALNEIEPSDIFKVLWKEFRVSLLVGVCLALVNFARIMIFNPGNTIIAAIVSVSLIFTIMLSKIIAAVLPMLVKKLGADPALMASPLITTIVDALSLMVYFSIAQSVLGIS